MHFSRVILITSVVSIPTQIAESFEIKDGKVQILAPSGNFGHFSTEVYNPFQSWGETGREWVRNDHPNSNINEEPDFTGLSFPISNEGFLDLEDKQPQTFEPKQAESEVYDKMSEKNPETPSFQKMDSPEKMEPPTKKAKTDDMKMNNSGDTVPGRFLFNKDQRSGQLENSFFDRHDGTDEFEFTLDELANDSTLDLQK
jgi:hypothetical protein